MCMSHDWIPRKEVCVMDARIRWRDSLTACLASLTGTKHARGLETLPVLPDVSNRRRMPGGMSSQGMLSLPSHECSSSRGRREPHTEAKAYQD